MQAKYIQCDDTIDYVTPSDVVVGQVIVVGNAPLPATHAAKAGETVALATEGVHEVVKDSGSWSDGDDLFWTVAGNPVGGSAGTGAISDSGTYYMGRAVGDAVTGDATAKVMLNGARQTSTITSRKMTLGGSTAAAGSTHSDATGLPAGTAEAYPVTGADDTKGVIIDVADKVTGRSIAVLNLVSNKILKIYPPPGGTINGASADAAFSTVSGHGAKLICTDASGNHWATLN